MSQPLREPFVDFNGDQPSGPLRQELCEKTGAGAYLDDRVIIAEIRRFCDANTRFAIAQPVLAKSFAGAYVAADAHSNIIRGEGGRRAGSEKPAIDPARGQGVHNVVPL